MFKLPGIRLPGLPKTSPIGPSGTIGEGDRRKAVEGWCPDPHRASIALLCQRRVARQGREI